MGNGRDKLADKTIGEYLGVFVIGMDIRNDLNGRERLADPDRGVSGEISRLRPSLHLETRNLAGPSAIKSGHSNCIRLPPLTIVQSLSRQDKRPTSDLPTVSSKHPISPSCCPSAGVLSPFFLGQACLPCLNLPFYLVHLLPPILQQLPSLCFLRACKEQGHNHARNPHARHSRPS